MTEFGAFQDTVAVSELPLTGVQASSLQSDGQSSLLEVFPSSQVSPVVTIELPQPVGVQFTSQPSPLVRLASSQPSPMPSTPAGPLPHARKTLIPASFWSNAARTVSRSPGLVQSLPT